MKEVFEKLSLKTMGCPKLVTHHTGNNTFPSALRVVHNTYQKNQTSTHQQVVQKIAVVFWQVRVDEKGQILRVDAYVLNNPMKYTDPSGELPVLLIAMVVGAYMGGVAANYGDYNPTQWTYDETTFSYMFGGAIFSGIGASVGAGVGASTASLFPTGTNAALVGATSGAAGGLAGGAVNGLWQAGLTASIHPGREVLSGAVSSLIGGSTNSLLQNAGIGWQALGTVGSGALAGGVGAEVSGGNFWDGARNGAISAGLNHAIYSIETGILKNQLKKVFENYPTYRDENGNLTEIPNNKAFEMVSDAAYKKYLKGEYHHACATRMSLAFEKAGVKIPNKYKAIETSRGGNVILSAEQMHTFMSTKYSSLMTNYSSGTSTRGIYIGLAKPGLGYSGHVTIMRSGFNSYDLGVANTTGQYFWSIP